MIGIVTDSSSDLSSEVCAAHHIELVPLTIRFGEEELVDRRDIDTSDFWVRLKASTILPETAAPSPGAFLDAYKRLAAAGAEGALAICLSSGLSGTYQSAVLAAEQYSDIPVKVIDSTVVSAALGLQVLAAADGSAAQMPLEKLTEAALANTGKSNVFAALDTLEYLRRGGRIGAASALLAGILDVKPLISLADGAVAPAGRVRTRSKALAAITDHLLTLGDRVSRVSLMHGGGSDLAGLAAAVRTALPNLEPLVTEIGPVVGTHTGPGLVGVAYLLD
jgi:DegV family protein with EDD domain